MKKLITIAAGIALASTAAFAAADAPKAAGAKAPKAAKVEAPIVLETDVKPVVTGLKVQNPETGLIVGNSYSFYNCGVHGYIRGLTREAKQKWSARIVTISSAALSWHDMPSYLKPEKKGAYARPDKPKFDVVFLQGQSLEPIKSKDAFKKSVKEAVDLVRAAGGEAIVVDTWARRGKPEQTKQLADATIEAANEANAICLPVGLAFAEALKQRPDLVMHNADGSHPSAAGSYLYGAMAYSVLYKKSPEKMYYTGECDKPISSADAAFLQKLAWKVVSKFYGWQ